jgi:hypothetical protein
MDWPDRRPHPGKPRATLPSPPPEPLDKLHAPVAIRAPPGRLRCHPPAQAPPPAPGSAPSPSPRSPDAPCSRAALPRLPTPERACAAREKTAANSDGYSASGRATHPPGTESAAACNPPGRRSRHPRHAKRHRLPPHAPGDPGRTRDDRSLPPRFLRRGRFPGRGHPAGSTTPVRSPPDRRDREPRRSALPYSTRAR